MNRRDTLTASGAERWIECPGSARLSENIPRQDTVYSDEGNLAHALSEQMIAYALKTGEAERGILQRFKHGTKVAYKDKSGIVSQEMIDYALVYVKRVLELKKMMNGKVELEVNVAHQGHKRRAFADAIVVGQKREIAVVDFKYGYTPVRLVSNDGAYNPQLLYYAAGALEQYPRNEVQIEIVQPRCQEVETIQSVVVPARDILHWKENTLWEAMHAVDADDAPLKTGSHCRFCPALAVCPEVYRQSQELAKADFDELTTTRPPAIPIDPKQLSRVLAAAPLIDAWLRACEAEAQAQMERGGTIDGFKLVKKRANREWPDLPQGAILKALGKRSNVDECFTKPELLSPAKMEKVLGKEVVNAVAVKPDAGLTIAAESDRREAVVSPAADFEDLL